VSFKNIIPELKNKVFHPSLTSLKPTAMIQISLRNVCWGFWFGTQITLRKLFSKSFRSEMSDKLELSRVFTHPFTTFCREKYDEKYHEGTGNI